MKIDYDVAIVGGGPAGLYSSIVLQRGIPTQSTSENMKIGVFDAGPIGGLANHAFIQISKKWAFSGTNVRKSFVEEANEINIHLEENIHIEKVETSSEDRNILVLHSKNRKFTAKYVILAIGIVNNPFVLRDLKVIIGLHTPQHMLEEIEMKNMKNIILYGPYKQSLIQLKNYFEENGHLNHISINKVNREQSGNLPGIGEEEYNQFDGIVLDYNSYKVINGATQFIELEGVHYEKGFILTDEFGKTHNDRIYAAGTVSELTTGILISLSSAIITSLSVGRKLRKELISEPSGRFPWFPREDDWEESWLPYLERLGVKSNDGSIKRK
ncbi:FAD-dependent oxidoreductase [Virgibacillus natechei]